MHLLLLPFLLAVSAKPVKIEPMLRNLETRRGRHLLQLIRDITEIQFSDLSAPLTDDVVVMAFRLTERVPYIGPIGNLEDDFKGLEQVEAPVDRCQADPPLLLMKRAIDLLRTLRRQRRGEFLINQEPGMAHSESVFSD